MKKLIIVLLSISFLFAQSESKETILYFMSESEFTVKPFNGELKSSDIEFCMESHYLSSEDFYEAISSLDNFHAVIRKTSEPCKFMVIFGGVDLEGHNVLYCSYIIRS